MLASFAGDSTDAAGRAIGTVVVNSKPLLTIIGEQPLLFHKTNKKGKPIGRADSQRIRFRLQRAIEPHKCGERR